VSAANAVSSLLEVPAVNEEQHHSSWLFGDPATPILRAYCRAVGHRRHLRPAKPEINHLLIGVARNFQRAATWLAGTPRARTGSRRSPPQPGFASSIIASDL